MKITNPSVILKDGLWYGYTANSEAALVKISNQEEVEKYVRIVNAWEAYKITDTWNPTPDAIYKLDGYVMEVTQSCGYFNSELTGCDTCGHDCYKPEKTATISPIQKQEPGNQEELWNDVISLLDIATFQNRAVEMLKDRFTITRKP